MISLILGFFAQMATFLDAVLPNDPFQQYIQNAENIEQWMGWLNWLTPVGEMATIFSMVLGLLVTVAAATSIMEVGTQILRRLPGA